MGSAKTFTSRGDLEHVPIWKIPAAGGQILGNRIKTQMVSKAYVSFYCTHTTYTHEGKDGERERVREEGEKRK